MTWRIWSIFMREVSSLKICTLMSLFCPKHVKFWMEKYKRVMPRYYRRVITKELCLGKLKSDPKKSKFLSSLHFYVGYNGVHEKCPYSELFWSAFFRIRTEYGEIRTISPYSVQMRKNADQNNSEYGHFLRSDRVEEVSGRYFRRIGKIFDNCLGWSVFYS